MKLKKTTGAKAPAVLGYRELTLGAGTGTEGDDLITVLVRNLRGHGADTRNAVSERSRNLSGSPVGTRQGEFLTRIGDDYDSVTHDLSL